MKSITQLGFRHKALDDRVVAPKIRIAHVQLLPILSGCQQVSLDTLRKLDRDRFEPYVICQSDGPLAVAARKEGICCLYADQLVRPISPYRDFKALLQLIRIMRDNQFDIVHTHSSKTGALGRIAARLAGVPVVMHTVHGFVFPAVKPWSNKGICLAVEWLSARFCDMTICLKPSDMLVARKWLHVPEDKLRLIPNGVATEKYRPLSKLERAKIHRETFEIGGKTLAIGTVGRLWPQKNPLCFVKTADILLSHGIHAEFFLIGDGVLRPVLEREIKRLGREEQIHVLGWRMDVPQLVAALDLFVLTSRWEGLSLALLEALACGIPVVASDIPGNREAIVEGVDGLLAECGDPRSFADQIQKLLNHPGLRQEYGKAARHKIVKDYRLDARVEKVESIYRRLAPNLDQVPFGTTPNQGAPAGCDTPLAPPLLTVCDQTTADNASSPDSACGTF